MGCSLVIVSKITGLARMMAKLPVVKKWRETLTDFQRLRWSSPQSIMNDVRQSGPVVAQKARSHERGR
jgi:hypothetical protein